MTVLEDCLSHFTGQVCPVQTTKISGDHLSMYILTFLTKALDGGEYSASLPGRFITECSATDIL